MNSGQSNTGNKLTTNNADLERLVLGAFLLNEENYWAVSEILAMDMFASEDHQKIFCVIHELAADARAIRVHIVAGRIAGLSNGQDPEAYLSMLQHMASKEESIPLHDYVLELRDGATRRRVIALAENMIKIANDPKYHPDQIVDRAAERIADISRAAAIEHESTLSSTITAIIDTSSKAGASMAIKPCLTGVEEMIGAFLKGTLVLWGGAPGSAKTAAAMQQLLFSSAYLPCSLFELEMDNKALVARSIAAETGVTIRDIMRGLTDKQYEALYAAQSDLASRKLTIVSPSKMTIQQIRSRAFAHKRKFGLDVLVVDHLKLVDRVTKARMDPVERAYENAFDLKALAKDLDCCVIGLCQFTKAARQKDVPEPEMEDFYGGSLEEHADVMLANFNRNLWLRKNPPQTNNAKVKEGWEGKIRMSEGKIEVYKLKDRTGSSRDRRIFGWDGMNTRLYDLFATQQTMSFANDEEAADSLMPVGAFA